MKYDNKTIYNITTEQAKDIKEVLGSSYSIQIEEYLLKHKVINTKGLPYSSSSIRQCFNRLRISELAFKKIKQLYISKKRNKERLNKSLNDL